MMDDHDLVRAAMQAADPAPEVWAPEGGTAVARLRVVPEAIDGPEDSTPKDGRTIMSSGPGRRRSLAMAAAAVAAVVAVSAAAVIVSIGPAENPTVAGIETDASSDTWCRQRPLLDEPASERAADLRVFHTASLAHALISAELAPTPIIEETAVVAEDERRIFDELEAADWDGSSVDRSPSPQARAAEVVIAEYRSNHCD